MTQPKLQKWLRDLAAACDLIVQHTAGRSLAEYESDRFLQSGVERNFEIIGEILIRITRTAPDLTAHITGVRDIIGFRNILAHGYDIVDHERVWRIIHDNLAVLRAEVAAMLTELEGEAPSPNAFDAER